MRRCGRYTFGRGSSYFLVFLRLYIIGAIIKATLPVGIRGSEIVISDVMVKGSISNGKESTIELQVENTK